MATPTEAPRRARAIHGILLLDKPAGITSNDAVQQVKRIYRAAKAGHVGSLDPLATGLLPIALGEATKLCAYLLDSDKRYSVTAQIGTRTDTGDAEGKPIASSDAGALSRDRLLEVLPRFVGEQQQRAPMFSARKQGGRRLYELARAGIEVERAPHRIVIHDLRLTAFGEGRFSLEVHCSKGTYIRTLVEDLAAAAGQAAHVAILRREEVAPFGSGPLVTLEALRGSSTESNDARLLPCAAALRGWPTVTVDAPVAARLAHGQAVPWAAPAGRAGRTAVLDAGGSLLGIAEWRADGLLAPRRWLSYAGAAAS